MKKLLVCLGLLVSSCSSGGGGECTGVPLTPLKTLVKFLSADQITEKVKLIAVKGNDHREFDLAVVDSTISGRVDLSPGIWNLQVVAFKTTPDGIELPVAYAPFGETNINGCFLDLKLSRNDYRYEEPAADANPLLNPQISLPNGCQKLFDCDGDTVPNYWEFLGQSDPQNASSLPPPGPLVDIVSPKTGEGVKDLVTIEAQAFSVGRGVLDLTLESPQGLIDQDGTPSRLRSVWDTRDYPKNTAFDLVFKTKDPEGNVNIINHPIRIENYPVFGLSPHQIAPRGATVDYSWNVTNHDVDSLIRVSDGSRLLNSGSDSFVLLEPTSRTFTATRTSVVNNQRRTFTASESVYFYIDAHPEPEGWNQLEVGDYLRYQGPGCSGTPEELRTGAIADVLKTETVGQTYSYRARFDDNDPVYSCLDHEKGSAKLGEGRRLRGSSNGPEAIWNEQEYVVVFENYNRLMRQSFSGEAVLVTGLELPGQGDGRNSAPSLAWNRVNNSYWAAWNLSGEGQFVWAGDPFDSALFPGLVSGSQGEGSDPQALFLGSKFILLHQYRPFLPEGLPPQLLLSDYDPQNFNFIIVMRKKLNFPLEGSFVFHAVPDSDSDAIALVTLSIASKNLRFQKIDKRGEAIDLGGSTSKLLYQIPNSREPIFKIRAAKGAHGTYGLVWGERLESGEFEVRFLLVNGQGEIIAGPHTLGRGQGAGGQPHLAWNGEKFLAVWAENQVWGALIDGNGAPDGAAFRVGFSDGQSSFPFAVPAEGQWGVFWSDQFDDGPLVSPPFNPEGTGYWKLYFQAVPY